MDVNPIGRRATQEITTHLTIKDFSQEVIMIRKTSGGYKVLSEKGKNLGGPYKTRAEAEKRLRQVEFFKRRKG